MPKFDALSEAITKKIEEAQLNNTLFSGACKNSEVIRRKADKKDDSTVWRPAFVRDIDKILYSPYYNRYTDKTQVFSLVNNDDITRRSLHVQLVSRISKTIGAALGLNLDLIEAIALGHDIGHPPFAHAGEKFLDELSFKKTGRHFYHNIQSVRVLDKIFPNNISLQTLHGIASHNGEFECEEYRPVIVNSFEEFDAQIERCYSDPEEVLKMMPCTLEGAIVRIADIIAYLGKDRQDAIRINTADDETFFDDGIGSINQEIINNLEVSVIENSYGKDYIKMGAEHFEALRKSKIANYSLIYNQTAKLTNLNDTVKPMMAEIYDKMYDDLVNNRKDSPIFKHHIDYVNQSHYPRSVPYERSEPNQIVVDYIASMTDDYLIDLHHFLFPDSGYYVEYTGYFMDLMNSRNAQA